jgi:excisionase family DNA binding protein
MRTILDEQYVTVAEAARLLQVHPATIRRWIDAGQLPAHRVGQRRVLVRRVDLEQAVRPAHDTKPGSLAADPELARLFQPITPEERRQGLAAVERARRSQAEQLAKRGGVPYPSSWELINELRDERSRQLG